MDSFLLCSILVLMMFVGGGRSDSQSMSCSMVNGVQQCTTDRSSGNTAMSSSQSGFGSGGPYQSNMASTGNSGTGDFNVVSQRRGNPPPGGVVFSYGPGFGFPGYGGPGNGAAAGAASGNGGNTQTFTSTGQFPGGAGAFAGGGAFAGNMAPGGFNPFAWVFGR